MADVMSGRAEEAAEPAGVPEPTNASDMVVQGESSEMTEDEAAALMAELMNEAKAAGIQADGAEASETVAEEVPKPAKSRKKKQAAE